MTLTPDLSTHRHADIDEDLDPSLNLVEDPWIPVRRKDGTFDEIRPADVLDFGPDGDNPPVALAAVRPDFNGALIQFLIGLVQTAFAPKDARQWKKVWRKPPTVEELHREFSAFAHAFDVEGDGPRFMQDLDPLEGQKPKPVIQLLVETPAGQSLKHNKDHFIKDRGEQRLCSRCAVLSLLTLQLNAPGGGKGHRTSLRGGGPLNTIIMGRTLWETVWLNVRHTKHLDGWTSIVSNAAGDVFPWLQATRTSEKKGGTNTTPLDVHPAQVFWNMPRRVRLLPPEGSEKVKCELCGDSSKHLYAHYVDKAYGTNYEGAWEHPLTPHTRDKDGRPNPAKGQPGGLSYRHWRGYVASVPDGNQTPALVVTQFFKLGQSSLADGDELFRFQPRLWAFGYDADNAKIRSWHESMMPIHMLSEEIVEAFERCALELIAAADFVAYVLGAAIKNALYGTPTVSEKGKVKWRVADGVSTKAGLFQQIDMEFWQQTEEAFYDGLEQARDLLLAGENELRPVREAWAKTIRDAALGLFDANSQFGSFYGADPKAVVLARKNLKGSTSAYNKKFRELLNLLKPSNKKEPKS
jgi:CRISPR system Cascade subunit CasA